MDKKSKKSYFGYKSHTNIDKEHGLIRNYKITDSSVYYGHVFEDIYLHGFDLPAYRNGAYRFQGIENFIRNCGGKSKIQWK